MKYHPIVLRVAERACLVIGGGHVAQQKAQSLLRAGAQVTVVSPQVTATLAALAAAQRITHRARQYVRGDLQGVFLAYAATNDPQLHEHIACEARERGVLLNVVDCPRLCDFIMPAVLQRGDLLIAVSTSGTSPALAKRIRQDLEGVFGVEYDLVLQLLGRLRRQLAAHPLTPAQRRRMFAALVDSPLIEYVRARRATDIDRLLASTVGSDVSLAALGMELT